MGAALKIIRCEACARKLGSLFGCSPAEILSHVSQTPNAADERRLALEPQLIK